MTIEAEKAEQEQTLDVSEETKQEEDDFVAGFENESDNAMPEADDSGDDVPEPAQDDESEEAEAAEPAAAEAKPEEGLPEKDSLAEEPEGEEVSPRFQKMFDDLSSRMTEKMDSVEHYVRSNIGRIDALQSALSEAQKSATAQGAASPSNEEIKEAAESTEKFDNLKKEFPEWGDALDESMHVVQRRVQEELNLPQFRDEVVTAAKQETAATLNEFRQVIRIDRVHPDWETTVKTEAFGKWLEGQPSEMASLADSEDAADAIKMLNAYAEHQEESAKKTKEREARTRRLEGNVAPTKGADTRPSAKSDDQEFEEGYYDG